MSTPRQSFWRGWSRGGAYALLIAAPFMAGIATEKQDGWLMAFAMVYLGVGILIILHDGKGA